MTDATAPSPAGRRQQSRTRQGRAPETNRCVLSTLAGELLTVETLEGAGLDRILVAGPIAAVSLPMMVTAAFQAGAPAAGSSLAGGRR